MVGDGRDVEHQQREKRQREISLLINSLAQETSASSCEASVSLAVPRWRDGG